ncbi:hypothetical protein [Bordetella sp. 2513F-2]
MKRRLAGLATAALLLLGGCAATGHNFDPDGLSRLTPGQTTMAEAAQTLAAPPDRVYPQSDGTTLALWHFNITFVPDGLYSRKQALLQFGPDGRLVRLVDSSNILLEPWARRKLLGPAPTPSAGAAYATEPVQALPIAVPPAPAR